MTRTAKDMTVDQAIGKRIRAHRKLSGLSQETLGDKVGLTFQQIQKYEKGTNRVSGSRLVSIADVLNVTVATLTGEHGTRRGDEESILLLATDGAARLLRAYSKIKNRTLRTSIVHMIENMTLL